MQLLMMKNLALDRAAELLDMGQQYTGGFPEVLFELLGPWFARFSLLLVSGILNFLVAWTFWLKCSMLAVAYIVERVVRRSRASGDRSQAKDRPQSLRSVTQP